MIQHIEINNALISSKIRKKELILAGNINLKIYGTLHCTSGKRMNKENRLFFTSETEAIRHGYRPCGHCMKNEYLKWKNNS